MYFVLALCLLAREPYEEVLRVLTGGIPGSRALARVLRVPQWQAERRLGVDPDREAAWCAEYDFNMATGACRPAPSRGRRVGRHAPSRRRVRDGPRLDAGAVPPGGAKRTVRRRVRGLGRPREHLHRLRHASACMGRRDYCGCAPRSGAGGPAPAARQAPSVTRFRDQAKRLHRVKIG
ncbi:hypothetical protein ACN6LM_006220 [Streptomyces sp. SAS_281]|uniref:hypothetical protein n=1 Tax=Streptomyces sp. SAS_281 TaxID=3412744 RepID=UPI00403C4412